jgi:hypothetical protein
MKFKPNQIKAATMPGRQLMNKIGVWDLSNVFQHPSGHCDVDQNDVCIDLLFRKLCPVHLTPLVLYKVTSSGGDYIREKYGCMSCGCSADFVGDELKSDSVGRTLYFINLMINEEKEFAAAINNPAAKGSVKV